MFYITTQDQGNIVPKTMMELREILSRGEICGKTSMVDALLSQSFHQWYKDLSFENGKVHPFHFVGKKTAEQAAWWLISTYELIDLINLSKMVED